MGSTFVTLIVNEFEYGQVAFIQKYCKIVIGNHLNIQGFVVKIFILFYYVKV